MTFIDVLRSARTSRAAVLHEFWTQYDPSQQRIHVFFEGHDDAVFFTPFIEQYLPSDSRLFSYRCDGKGRVFEAFQQITLRLPGERSTLFFVDKDLDDILGTPWPTDPRIFFTDVYSVENYIATKSVLEKFYRDSVRLVNVKFDEGAILVHFEEQLARFHRCMLVVTAWILVARRIGMRPNLNNVAMGEIFDLSDECELKARKGGRLAYLIKTTGILETGSVFRQVSHATRELARLPPKRIIRGKFEAWFFVEFWKRLVAQLRELVQEGGGKVTFRLTLEHSSFIATLTRYVEIPSSLKLFLEAHFPRPSVVAATRLGVQRRSSRWWKRLFGPYQN